MSGLWWERAESVREAARESTRSTLEDPGPRREYPLERARVRRELRDARQASGFAMDRPSEGDR